MKILNFGSLNIDHVYRVKNFVRPGETIAATEYHRFAGGKGLNQSIALARAGMTVLHAGRIGTDGMFLKEILEEESIDCRSLEIPENEVSGHAVIQVSDTGENCIVLFSGANGHITSEQIDKALGEMDPGDFLLLQNEISRLEEIIRKGADRGLRIFFNPAPMTQQVRAFPFDRIETLIVNETEAASLAGLSEDKALSALRDQFPKLNILMTLGAQGALYAAADSRKTVLRVPAEKVEKVVDTTAAGDTFIGYYLASIAKGLSPEEAMRKAAKASAICVGIAGAANSIPRI